jgi:hypothetical protein
MSGRSFLDNLYGVFFSPGRTFAALAANPPLGQAVVVFLLVNVVSAAISAARLASGIASEGRFALPGVAIFVMMVMALIGWFLLAAVLHLAADFAGGAGRGLTVFALLAFASAPGLLAAPVGMFAGTAAAPIAPVASLAISAWGVWLAVLAIQHSHGLTLKRSLAAVFVPVIVLAVLLVIVLVTAGIAALTLPFFKQGTPFIPRL